MRVIEFSEYGDPDVLRMAQADTPSVDSRSVRIRVAAAAVNPADVKWRAGMFRTMVPLRFPHILGYDVAGIVDAIGAEVTAFKAGDRIVGTLDHIAKGGYAEYAVLMPESAAAIPDGVDFATAAAIPTAGLTGVQMIEEHIELRSDESVLITGATGAVGRFAVASALRRGARVIAAVRANHVAQAKALGAHDVLVLGEQQWTGAPFNHVADTIGGPAVASLCRHVARGGRIRTAATTPIDPQGLPCEPQFFAVHADGVRLAQLLVDVAAGRIVVPVARRLPLAEAATAHRLVEAGGLGGKVILEP